MWSAWCETTAEMAKSRVNQIKKFTKRTANLNALQHNIGSLYQLKWHAFHGFFSSLSYLNLTFEFAFFLFPTLYRLHN